MGIKDIPGILSRTILKKEAENKEKVNSKTDDLVSKDASTKSTDSIDITDAKLAIEKENIIASNTSIEDFDQAKSVLISILNDVDEKNLLDIHGNADKIKTFLVM